MTVPDGACIVRQGDEQDSVYLVEDGTVLVQIDHLGGEIVVNELGPGDLFGEVSFVDGGVASASCVADGTTRLRRFDRSALDALVADDPTAAAEIYRAFAVVLAGRVRRLTPSAPPAWGGS